MTLQAVENYVRNKIVAVLGYNSDGQEQAAKLRERGIQVIVGLRDGDPYWRDAEKDGFNVYSLYHAVDKADVIQVWY